MGSLGGAPEGKIRPDAGATLGSYAAKNGFIDPKFGHEPEESEKRSAQSPHAQLFQMCCPR